MLARQRIIPERRSYNQWVASETLEDYALRYTASHARKSAFRVGNTAFGPIAFLACEAIGGAITLLYGFHDTAIAIALFGVVMFLIGLPISAYGARYGVDIDLLTRGAGFGYIGSTITSLIYASFTFLLFSIEASIMSVALQMLFGIPLAIGHLLSALLVIPIALYGISLISRVQVWTQPIWLFLQVVPLAYIIWKNPADIEGWTAFAAPADGPPQPHWLMIGAAASVLLSLLPQIGEQVDYLRFMPVRSRDNRVKWWLTVIGTGPGWVVLGGLKLLAGSFLAYVLLSRGLAPERATDPTSMYHMAFTEAFGSSTVALVAAGIFVIVCQVKINVTNAYAGSIAWSNFFSRVTHTHPGRVVWLVFNVLLALMLMELGVFRTIESVLSIYANFAAGWIGAVTADLVINKTLGLSPRGLEFKRAHLYDINPVGVGALLLSVAVSSAAYVGLLGEVAKVLSPFVALFVSFAAAPLIAVITRGRFYIARTSPQPEAPGHQRCTVCENQFESADMALCPAYGGAICSLCCSLDARCHDQCKPEARLSEQAHALLTWLLPTRAVKFLQTTAGRFFSLLLLVNLLVGLLLYLIHAQMAPHPGVVGDAVRDTLWMVYFSFLLLSGIVTWMVVLAHESRRAAESDSARQTTMLMDEIEAHQKTDLALQRAKEVAEAANLAKSRYIVGLGHEIRTPLNSIYGYAQLLERSAGAPTESAVRVIRRSAEHLTSLVDGLLDISRIEGGVLRLSRDKLHLTELLDQLEDMFRLQAQNKGIEFRSERAPHLPEFVYTDQKRLRQILINLLSNAVKYTDAGFAALTVRYRNQVAEFEVADSGMGIPEAELQRIFEPFERGQDAARRGIPGTGLGLTITKLLTQVLGGEINVQSVAGKGTTFTVRLFLSEAMRDETLGRARRVTGYAGPRRSVLLIDDAREQVDMMTLLLTSLGFEVASAASGEAGLAALEAHRPDLLLLDITMPGMTGWEVLARIRQHEHLRDLAIVMVSANAHEYQPAGLHTQHDGFLTKPVDLQVLLDTLARCLRLEWRYDSERDQPAQQPAAPDGRGAAAARHHLEDLWQLGRIGHVRGIHAKLRDIEAEDPATLPITTYLRGLVEGFEMKRYMEVVGELRAE